MRVRDRLGAGILLIATVLGVWVGLTAPQTSPVQTPQPGQAAVTATAP